MILHYIISLRNKIYVFFLSLFYSKKFTIVDENVIGFKVNVIKEESVESIHLPPIYGLSKGGCIDYIAPELALQKIEHCKIYHGSDFITKGEYAFWKKFYTPQWQKMLPSDSFIVKVKKDILYIRKSKSKEHYVDTAFSMLGVHSSTWSHFLFQYFAKLLSLSDITSREKNVTVVHPVYTDPQVNYIFNFFTSKFPNVNFLQTQAGDVVNCKVLYHVNSTSQISDHATYITSSDIIIPQFVLDAITNNLRTLLAASAANLQQDTSAHKKIYLGRKGQRNLTNSLEVEAYFKSEGFTVIYLENITLDEKYRIFQNAEIIAGPGSSAFSNIIFSKPGTKVLMFSNYQRLNDALSYFKYFGIKLLLVNDQDENQTIHSSYSISLDKLIKAYKHLINDCG